LIRTKGTTRELWQTTLLIDTNRKGIHATMTKRLFTPDSRSKKIIHISKRNKVKQKQQLNRPETTTKIA